MPHENKIYLLILGKTRSTRQLWRAATLHSLRRRKGRLHNGILSHTCGLLYTTLRFSARRCFYPCVCFRKHCVVHFICLHGVFLVFSNAGPGAGYTLPYGLAAEHTFTQGDKNYDAKIRER